MKLAILKSPVADPPANTAERADARGVARNDIFVRRLRLDARIGVYDWEKAAPQPILLDLECALPSGHACLTDRIEHTIDYEAIVERLRAFALDRPCELVEAMAEGMAALVQADFGVPWLRLTLTKLAPFPGAEVGITIERGKQQGARSTACTRGHATRTDW